MKRESARIIEANIDETPFGDAMRDALDSDARQRREIRALRRYLNDVRRGTTDATAAGYIKQRLAALRRGAR
jgi:hypothetical protein